MLRIRERGQEVERRGVVEVERHALAVEHLLKVVLARHADGVTGDVRMAADGGERIERPEGSAGGQDLALVLRQVAHVGRQLEVEEFVEAVLHPRAVAGGVGVGDPAH